MKLKKARITNFRSVEDSGEFDVFDLLCLVGKNEAGKSAIQQALGGINLHPSTPLPYDIERDHFKAGTSFGRKVHVLQPRHRYE